MRSAACQSIRRITCARGINIHSTPSSCAAESGWIAGGTNPLDRVSISIHTHEHCRRQAYPAVGRGSSSRAMGRDSRRGGGLCVGVPGIKRHVPTAASRRDGAAHPCMPRPAPVASRHPDRRYPP
ncbi:hypothetical protein IG631_12862 [Alternaria alternata]|nr:hypothetical protein IG631_12862 [Alternaria alternata]